MVDEAHSKERVRAQLDALTHEAEGYDAKIAGAKTEGDKDKQGRYEARQKQVAEQVKSLKARLAGKGGKDAPELVEPAAADEESLEE